MAGRQRRSLISPPEAEEVDHISHIPEAIIHRIFSFLPFKDVVKTSVLSKQWRFAWTYTPWIDPLIPGSRRQRLISPPEEAEVDHISHMPEPIIHRIFSFLPFKDVVKTSVLSKQWRFAWTSTPYIDLFIPSEGVVPLISRALSLCTATKLEKFHLVAPISDLCIYAELDRWFLFAVARKVEDASLVFVHRYNTVPQCLRDCVSLVSLRVSHCVFPRDIIIHWPSLKRLCIQHVKLEKDTMTKILSNCPVLESLTLRFICGLHRVRIDSRSLRELVIEVAYIGSLDISAPNMLALSLSGRLCLRDFRLIGASSLAEAEVNFLCYHYRFCQSPKSVFQQVQHVAKITIGSTGIEVLSAMEAKETFYLSSRWRDIIVYAPVRKRHLLGIACLLRIAPLLEKLVICTPKSDNIKSKNEDFEELYNFGEKKFWCSPKKFCVTNRLKRIEIIGLEFDKQRSKLLLAFAKLLLEEAVGLEKMIIDIQLKLLHPGVPIDPHDLSDFQDVIHLQEGCRKASQNAQVVVNYHFNEIPNAL